jgi:hypothetical protein
MECVKARPAPSLGWWRTDILAPHGLDILAYAIISDIDLGVFGASTFFLRTLAAQQGNVRNTLHQMLRLDPRLMDEIQKWSAVEGLTTGEIVAALET